ncbi:glycine/sarcosine/betaine reductase selenoprotein B family protein [soil metagenome]
MASYNELNIATRMLMRAFPFSRYAIKDAPVTPLAKPLSECRVALVTTAGLRLKDDLPYDRSIKFGDTSYREIPDGVAVQYLIEDHKSSSFDHSGVQADKNLAFPLDRFRELIDRGVIGSLNSRHFSFMGSLLGVGPLINESAPEAAAKLRSDGVDVVFLTPV